MIKRQLIFTVLIGLSLFAKAQTVTTYAGSQYFNQGDDAYNSASSGTPILQDSFSMPWAICADTGDGTSSYRFWFTDQNHLRIGLNGKSYLRAGYPTRPSDMNSAGYFDGTGIVAAFNDPHGVAVDPRTNIAYICDFGNNTIRTASRYVNVSNGTIVGTLAGKAQQFGEYKDGTTGPSSSWGTARFNGPQDIAITSTGIIYVSDQLNHCIRKITGGQVTTIAGDTTDQGTKDKDANGKAARFSWPQGLFLENDNSLLVADRNNGKIKRINLTSPYAVTTVVSGLFSPTDVVSVNGILYIADHYCIRMWDGAKLTTFVGKYGTQGFKNDTGSLARFGDIMMMTYHDKSKSIYAADLANNIFRKISVVQTPIADFWANKTTVSTNEIFTLHSNSKYANTFTWVLGGSATLQNGSKLTDSVLYVSYASTGVYNVQLTITNQAGNNVKLKTGYINVSVCSTCKPAADFTADKTIAKMTDTVKLIETSGNNPTSWAWVFTPATVTYLSGTTASSQNPKVKFTALGKYTVQLTATNVNGNNVKSKTDYINIVANAVNSYAHLNAILYPNPAQNTLYLGIAPKSEVVVSGVDGKEYPTRLTESTLDVSNLPAGVYLVRYMGPKGAVVSGKFVKIGD